MKKLSTLLILFSCLQFSFAQTAQSEDFNSGLGIFTESGGGALGWLSAVSAGGSIDGSNMAIVDDDANGSGAPAVVSTITGPAFDATSFTTLIMEFDYNFLSSCLTEFFSVEVFDGTDWVEVFLVNTDDCGFWGCEYPHAEIDVSAYINSMFQVRFTYDDGDGCWGYWAAIDNYVLYQPSAVDASIDAIIGPSSGCGLGADNPINITITNNGLSDIAGFDVGYVVEGPLPDMYTENVGSLIITPGGSSVYNFTTGPDLSAFGSYTITVYVSVSGDGDSGNDSITLSVSNIDAITSFPYYENFESGDGGWAVFGTGSTWALGSPAGTVINSAPPSTPSSTNSWMTNLTGNYNNSDNSWVLAPCMDFSDLSAPEVLLDIWWESEFSWDGAKLQSSIDGGATWQDVGAIGTGVNWYTDGTVTGLGYSGSQNGWSGAGGSGSGGWVSAKHDLTGLENQPSVFLRMAFGSDGSVNGFDGFTFDNFTVRQKPDTDAAITAISGPVSGCGLGAGVDLTITIQNLGALDLTGFDVGYELTGPAPASISENVGTFTVPSSGAGVYTFTTPLDFTVAGDYTITAWVSADGDGNNFNDTITLTISSLVPISSYPYFENFEAGPAGWLVFGTNSTWELGSPAGATINTPPTASPGSVNSWMTNLDGNYNNSDNSWLLAPCMDFSSLVAPEILFDAWWDGEFSWDGAKVQTSIDNGLTWQDVGAIGTGENWYNDATIVGLGYTGTQIGWTNFGGGGSGGWVGVKNDLTGLGGEVSVQVRIAFGSDGSVNGFDGFAFDNFLIRDKPEADLASIELISPTLAGCGFGTMETVSFIISNEGIADQTGFDVSYTVDGPTGTFDVTENVGALVVEALTTDTFTFVTPVNMSVIGTYTVTVTTNLTGDEFDVNDSFTQTITTVSPIPLPVTDNFDEYTIAAIEFDDLVNASDDDLDWQVNVGPTSTSPTGPNDDVSGGGGYIYIESSLASDGDQAVLCTPCVDLGGSDNPELEFSYHLFGTSIGSLSVDAVTSSGINNLFFVEGAQQLSSDDPFIDVSVDLSAYIGDAIQVCFTGEIVTGSDGFTFLGDMALDEITFNDPIPDDLGVTEITSPLNGCNLSSEEQISVVIENFGTADQTGFNISYVVSGPGGFQVATENTGDLFIPVDGEEAYTFTTPVDLTLPGTYTIVTYTNIPTDVSVGNDTSFIFLESIAVISDYPYLENFDAGAGGWTSGGTNSTWELATPANDVIDSAYSAPAAWVTNATGDYMNSDNSFVLSPCFDFSDLCNPAVSVQVWWESEFSWDGTNLQYTLDGGLTWVTVGDVGDMTNWYTDNSVNGLAWTGLQSGWSGRGTSGSNGYRLAAHELEALAGESSVRFRMTFGSDGSVSDEGIAFDNFSIFDIVGPNVGVAGIVTPVTGCEINETFVEVSLQNFNCDLSPPNFEIILEVDGEEIAVENYPGSLDAGEVITYTFTTSFDFATPGTYDLVAYTNLDGDINPLNDMSMSTVGSSLATPVTTGFDPQVCIGTTIFPSPSVGGGTWTGTGIIDPATGEFDPSIIGEGNSTMISYNFIPDEGYTVEEIPFSPVPPDEPVEINLTGDSFEAVSLPFTFQFFGNNYEQIFIGANGLITLGEGSTSIADQSLPDPTAPNNLIALMWDDLDPTLGGTISWDLVGFIPNRKFVITYDNIAHFGSGGTLTNTAQLIIYETTSVIEMHITEIVTDGLSMTQGIENIDGTEAYTSTPSTNQSPFTQSNVAYRYVQSICPGNASTMVNVLPFTPVDIGDEAILCGGSAISLDAGPGAISYEWSTGANTQTISVTEPGTYSVTYVDEIGCGVGAIDITGYPIIVINGLEDVVICDEDETGSFSAVVSGGVPDYQYFWSTGSTETSISDLPGGDYTLTVTDDVGCSASLTGTVIEAPPIVITTNSSPSSSDTPDGVAGIGVTGGLGMYTYLWSTGDITPLIENVGPGEYTVTVTDAGGCTGTATVVVGVKSGLNEPDFVNDIALFPNPTQGSSQLNVNLNGSFDIEVELFNMVGQIQDSWRDSGVSNRLYTIDLSGKASGIYNVKITIDGQAVNRRLVLTSD